MPSIAMFLWCGNQNDWCGHKLRPNHAHPLCLKFFLGRTLSKPMNVAIISATWTTCAYLIRHLANESTLVFSLRIKIYTIAIGCQLCTLLIKPKQWNACSLEGFFILFLWLGVQLETSNLPTLWVSFFFLVSLTGTSFATLIHIHHLYPSVFNPQVMLVQVFKRSVHWRTLLGSVGTPCMYQTPMLLMLIMVRPTARYI